MHFELAHLMKDAVTAFGLFAHFIIFAIVFAESGLLFGFFLPGDSLLFTAGFLASQGYLNLPLLLVGCFIAAVAGDQVGYWFGHRVGRRLFDREESFFFHRKNIERTEAFYRKHGGKTIVLARFLPAIRTFAPIVAGIGSMRYRDFVFYNIFGAVLWAIGVTLAGYFLGSVIPDVDKYLIPIILLIIFVSALPTLVHLWQDYRQTAVNLLRRRIFRRAGAEN
ncbi:MAG: VTT domain-containing protein [Chloroflexota bacterium]|nr:VTT domain-containing protein [Dehalococcoidia bacterium]MDW8255094.1 VTT domain-containing protein [Chloroflexota bacterium]